MVKLDSCKLVYDHHHFNVLRSTMLATFDDVIERDDDAVEYRRVLKDTTARLGSPSTTTTTKTKSNITSHQPNDRVMNNVDIMSRIPNLHPLPGTAMVVVKRNKSNQIHHRRRRLRSTSASSSSTFTTSSPSTSSSSSLLSRSSHSYIFGRTKFQIVSFVTILLFANLFIINEAVSINGNSNHKRTGMFNVYGRVYGNNNNNKNRSNVSKGYSSYSMFTLDLRSDPLGIHYRIGPIDLVKRTWPFSILLFPLRKRWHEEAHFY